MRASAAAPFVAYERARAASRARGLQVPASVSARASAPPSSVSAFSSSSSDEGTAGAITELTK